MINIAAANLATLYTRPYTRVTPIRPLSVPAPGEERTHRTTRTATADRPSGPELHLSVTISSILRRDTVGILGIPAAQSAQVA